LENKITYIGEIGYWKSLHNVVDKAYVSKNVCSERHFGANGMCVCVFTGAELLKCWAQWLF